MSDQPTPQQRHRRQVRYQIMLPMLGVTVLVIAVLLFTLAATNAPGDPRGMSVMGSIATITCCLVPTVVLCFIPYAVAAFMAAGLWKGNNVLARSLRRQRTRAVGAMQQAQGITRKAAKSVIDLNAKVAYYERMAGHTRPPDSPDKE